MTKKVKRHNGASKNVRAAETVSTPKESAEAQEMRESIEQMERELKELDSDITEARKGEKGELSKIALRNFKLLRSDLVVMIEASKRLYKAVLESEALERELGA